MIRLLKKLFFDFHYLLLKAGMVSHIKACPKQSLFIIIGRKDLGTQILHLHYAHLWKEEGNNIVLILLSPHFPQINKLSSKVFPHIPTIFPNNFFDKVLFKLFGYFIFERLIPRLFQDLQKECGNNMRYIFHPTFIQRPHYTEFCRQWVFQHSTKRFSHDFIEACIYMKSVHDYEGDKYKEYCEMTYRSPLKKFVFPDASSLLRKLSVRRDYVVFNINTKYYDVLRRQICHVTRYECLIDRLIELEYDVVIQGRNEQPVFAARKHLIQYHLTNECSIVNDLYLYSRCQFMIASKSGAELFGALCDIPVLGLNYTELSGCAPFKRARFYPKPMHDSASDRTLTWKEMLETPSFFDMGTPIQQHFNYIEMREEELINALEEFIPLTQGSNHDWNRLTPLQHAFLEQLSPLHLELYSAKLIPCDAFLRLYQ